MIIWQYLAIFGKGALMGILNTLKINTRKNAVFDYQWVAKILGYIYVP